MSTDRYVVLGHAHVRSEWFHELARRSTAAAIPIELVKTMSVEEVRVRLRAGRTYSALLIDDGVAGLDRELLDLATDAGVPVLVVDAGRGTQRWIDLGAASGLARDFSERELVQALEASAAPIPSVERPRDHDRVDTPGGHPSRLITVTGSRGSGRSTVAMAIAQGAATHWPQPGGVCLADFALSADLAMLHDSADIVPGLVELIEAHRYGTLTPDAVAELTWHVPARGYHLLLGLRQHREWSSLRPRSIAAALGGLRSAFAAVITDVDGELEGERATGSTEIEERNALSRTAVGEAELIVVTGLPGLHGTHALVRSLRDLLDHGVDATRILTVVNRAPRSPRLRAEISRALARLLTDDLRGEQPVPSPIFLGERRTLDAVLRAGDALPRSWAAALTTTVLAGLDRTHRTEPSNGITAEPVAITPGSLGSWAE